MNKKIKPMKTKHLDSEIERLNLLEITGDLSEYGKSMLSEFKSIKQALTMPREIPDSIYLEIERKKCERYVGVLNEINKQAEYSRGQCDTIETIEDWLKAYKTS